MYLSPLSITRDDDRIEVNYQRYVAGLRGELKSGWNWDVSAEYSTSDGDYTEDQVLDDAITPTDFVPGSCVGTNTPNPWRPLHRRPLAGPTVPGWKHFARASGISLRQGDGQHAIRPDVRGSLHVRRGLRLARRPARHCFWHSLPGGRNPRWAWRNHGGRKCLGIVNGRDYLGEDTTKAVFAEVEVPLLQDKFLADSLTLTASGRYTDVESYGSGDTYKVGTELGNHVDDTTTCQARRISFRAPALFELYLADQTSFIVQRFVDPCIGWGEKLAYGTITQVTANNCEADGIAANFLGGSVLLATTIAGGGFGILEAETSTSKTIGLFDAAIRRSSGVGRLLRHRGPRRGRPAWRGRHCIQLL